MTRKQIRVFLLYSATRALYGDWCEGKHSRETAEYLRTFLGLGKWRGKHLHEHRYKSHGKMHPKLREDNECGIAVYRRLCDFPE